MFTTDVILLMPVIGVATGLAVALFVVRAQELRLASVGFGVKGAKQLIPLYVKEGGMVALGIPLALVIFGSSALMLKGYLTPPRPVPKRVVIPWDPKKIPLRGINDRIIDDFKFPEAPANPTGIGKPRPVADDQAMTDDIGTQGDWAAQANAGTIDPSQLNRDSVEIVRDDVPDKGFVALDRYPELVKRIDPVYPSNAIGAGIEGRVCLQALLDIDGRVVRVEVAQSSGNASLDEAATDAVKQWVFTPAIAPDGKPTRVWQSCPITFRLAR
ncbi:energy transducer TonB [bacterium]|nr:energy transducer TonB [bacterium]